MSAQRDLAAPRIRLQMEWKKPWQRKMAPLVEGALERILLLEQLNEIYAAARSRPGPQHFCDKVLETLGVCYHLTERDRARIPASGAVLVVSNHPFGAVEGLILASLLRSVRPDVRILANFLLAQVAELRDLFFLVDPFQRRDSVRTNARRLLQSVECLRGAGMLALFPAGEVASIDLRQAAVLDPPWSDSVGFLIRKTRAGVLPLYFSGSNGPVFQMAGLVHPRLRTFLLPQELLNKKGTNIELRIGKMIPYRTLAGLADDRETTDYVRQRAFLLAERKRDGVPRRTARKALATGKTRIAAIAAAEPARHLAEEMAALPEESTLLRVGDVRAVVARASQIPHVLREIGRLREITFRKAGEGSGKERDCDSFDAHYLHVWLWHECKQEIIGAYRMAPSDEVLPQHGPKGFYTTTLFQFRKHLLRRIFPALELGRSFIRPEYQRATNSLGLLWSGIGRFLVRNPRYRFLFGPVSISDEYQPFSKQLMVEFLRRRYPLPDLARWVRPRSAFRGSIRRAIQVHAASNVVRDIDELSAWIAEVEDEGRGVPILVKHYLNLGGTFLGFNVDPAFGNCIDGLIVVDLLKADARLLARYMGRDGVSRFHSWHAQALPAAS